MGIRILSLPTLRTFYEQPEYADSKEPLLTWHGHVLKAKWQTPADVKADFGTASILKEGAWSSTSLATSTDSSRPSTTLTGLFS